MSEIFKSKERKNLCGTFWLLILIAVSTTFAHEGHDHSHDEPAAVSVGTEIETRSARIGDYEILMKNSLLEPDTPGEARLFLTWAQTNVPITTAVITITIERTGERTTEINAEPNAKLAGSYAAKLPPLPAGEVRIGARWTVGATTETADFGAAEISAHNVRTNAAEQPNWLPNMLFAVAALVALTFIILLVRSGVRRLNANKNVVEVNNHTVSA